ncbi:MAG: hypothetical protein PVJ83_09420, partial [Gammaproteobacteria bacterium]
AKDEPRMTPRPALADKPTGGATGPGNPQADVDASATADRRVPKAPTEKSPAGEQSSSEVTAQRQPHSTAVEAANGENRPPGPDPQRTSVVTEPGPTPKPPVQGGESEPPDTGSASGDGPKAGSSRS